VLSFVIDDIHPHDIGTILDQEGIAIPRRSPLRAAGDEAIQCSPLPRAASFAFYNTKAEVDILAGAIEKVIEVFS
jgi:cysteine desulfurase/selenocysteine lyase